MGKGKKICYAGPDENEWRKEILLLKKIVILKEKLNIILIYQYRLNNLKRVIINIHYKKNL